ncbi:MAG: hypothetical protein WDW38_007328 [Sanguina aurantia]
MCVLHSQTSRPGQTGVPTADMPGNDGGARRWRRKRWRGNHSRHDHTDSLPKQPCCSPAEASHHRRATEGRDKQVCPPRTCPATTAVRAGGDASGGAATTADTTTRTAYPAAMLLTCRGIAPPEGDGGRLAVEARGEGKATQRQLAGRCVCSTRKQAGRDKQVCPPRTCPATTAVRAGGDASGGAATTADTTTRTAYPSSHVAHLQRHRTSGGRRRPAVEGARRGQGYPTAPGRQMCALHSQTSRPGQTGVLPATTADMPGNDGGARRWRRKRWRGNHRRHDHTDSLPKQPCCSPAEASHLRRATEGPTPPAVEGARRGQGYPTAPGRQMCALHSQTSRPGQTGVPPATTADMPGNDGGARRWRRKRRLWRARGEGKATQRHLAGRCVPSTRKQAGRDKQACSRRPPRTCPATTAVRAGGDASGDAASTADTTTRAAYPSSHVAHLQRHRTSGGRRRPAVWRARSEGKATQRHLTGRCVPSTREQAGRDKQACSRRPPRTCPATTAVRAGGDASGDAASTADTTTRAAYPSSHVAHLQRRRTSGGRRRPAVEGAQRGQGYPTAPDRQMCALHSRTSRPGQTGVLPATTADLPGNDGGARRWRRKRRLWRARSEGKATQRHLTGRCVPSTREQAGRDKQACSRRPPRTCPATTAVRAGGDASGDAASTADTTTRAAYPSSHVAHLQRRRTSGGRRRAGTNRRAPGDHRGHAPATTAVRAGGDASGDAASTADTTTRAAYPSSHVAHLQRRRTSGGRRRVRHRSDSRLWRARSEGKATQRHLTGRCVPSTREQAGRDKQACSRRPPRTCPATTAVRAGGDASGDAASTADTTTRAAYPSSHVAHLQRRRTSGGRRRPAVEGAQRGQGYPTAPDRQMCALHSRTSRPGQTGVLPATTADMPGNDGGARRWRRASGDAASTADTTTRAAYPSSHVAHLQRRRTSGGRRRPAVEGAQRGQGYPTAPDRQMCALHSRTSRPGQTGVLPATTADMPGNDGGARRWRRKRRLWRARSEGKATQRHLTGRCVPSTREQAGRDKQACSRRPPRTPRATTAVRAGGDASGDAASTADTTTRAAYPSSHVAHLQRRRTSGGRRRPAVEGAQRGQGYPTAPDRQMCALHSRTSRPGQTGVLPATTATCPATTAVRAGGHASGDAASTADTTTRAAYPSSHVAHLQRRRTSGGRRRPAVEGAQRGQGYPTAPDRQMCALHSRTSRPGQTGVLPATTADVPGNDGGARRWPRKRRLWRARSEGKATQRHLTGRCVPSTREQAGRDKQACSRRPPQTCPATTAVRAGGDASGDAASTADTTTRAAYPSSHVAHLQRRRTSGGRRRVRHRRLWRARSEGKATQRHLTGRCVPSTREQAGRDKQACSRRPPRTPPATTAVRAGGHASGDAASTADTTTRAAYPSSHVAHLQRRRTSGGRRRPAVEGAQRGQGYPTAPDRQMCALHSRTSRPGQTGVLPATTADVPGNDGGARRWPRKRRLWRARSEGKATQRHLTGRCVPSTREQAGRDKQACSRRPPRTCPATTAVRAGGHASGDAASTADTTTRAAYPSSHVAHLQRRRTSGGRRRPAVEGAQRGQGYPTAPDRQMCALHSRTSRPGQTGVLPATTADVPGNDGGARRWPRKRRLWRARSEGKATQRHLTGRCVPSTREQAGRDKQACSRRPPRTCPATTAVRAGGHASGDAASTADTTTRAAYPSSHVAHLQRRRTSGGRRRPAVEGAQRGQGYPTAPDRQMCALHSRTSRPGQTGVLPATTADVPGNDGGARRWPRKRRLWRARSEGKATQRHLTGRCVPSTREQAGRDKQACSRRPPRTSPATTAVRAGGDASGDAASTADTTTRAAYPSSHERASH